MSIATDAGPIWNNANYVLRKENDTTALDIKH
jgi:hypothetical protein